MASRVGGLCSNCKKLSTGPGAAEDSTVNIGVAAHITAASKGGPRFDPSLSPEERQHANNGIWLCQSCAHLIDADEPGFPAERLRKLKAEAEEFALASIGGAGAIYPKFKYLVELDEEDQELLKGLALPTEDDLASITVRLNAATKWDLDAFKSERSWPRHAIALSMRMEDRRSPHALASKDVAKLVGLRGEVAIVAAPGTGKTTSLVQLAEAISSDPEAIAAFIPLGEWSTRQDTLLASLPRRNVFRDFREQHFMLLALHGRLTLVLDGWNELDPSSRIRAINELKALRRDFPLLQVVISTRRQARDVPLSGPIVLLEALSREQQRELATALGGSTGEALLDRALRTPGVRDLVSIPLYLTALLKVPSGAMPTTKEQILRLFVEEHEKEQARAEVLHRDVLDVHPALLSALAVEATRAANTVISHAVSRTVVSSAEDRLEAEGQITTKPQPGGVLDTLVAQHLLVRSGDGISFQHQQFQEWYASHEVEKMMRIAASGSTEALKRLRLDFLDQPIWEEAILFAVERMSRADNTGIDAVAKSIMHALQIDPMLAAEMIYRSAETVWDQVKQDVVAFARQWHAPNKVDRAVRFMIMTGRPEFADLVWPLISDADSQVHLEALRAAPRFRPAVLGSNVAEQLATLREDTREAVVSELAMNGGIEGIELCADLARSDPSPNVQAEAVGALFFRRADKLASDLLRSAHADAWPIVAKKGYVDDFADRDVIERLTKVRKAALEAESDPLRKLNIALHETDQRLEEAEIVSVISSPELPLNDQHIAAILATAYERSPSAVARALMQRLENGYALPFHGEEYLVAVEEVDTGPIAKRVLSSPPDSKVASAAVTIVGRVTLSKLIERAQDVHADLMSRKPQYDKELGDKYHELKVWLSKARTGAFLLSWLSGSDTTDPAQIYVLLDLFTAHFRDSQLATTHSNAQEVVAALENFGKCLLASPESTRGQMAEIAEAIALFPHPELLPILASLLAADLKQWGEAKEAMRKARAAGQYSNQSDASTSWTLQYARALIAIGLPSVARLIEGYLGHPEFGIDAAQVLKGLWEREQPPKERRFGSWNDFSEVRARQQQRAQGEPAPCPFSIPIFEQIEGLLEGQPDEAKQRRSLQLAAIAFGMPYTEKRKLIKRLLAIPCGDQRPLLTVLVQAGEIIPADAVLTGLRNLLEAAKTQSWRLDDNRGELGGWLELLPFTDRIESIFHATDMLEPEHRKPWRLRRMLEALRHTPNPQAEQVLCELAKRDPAFIAEHEWANALQKRRTISAIFSLLDVLASGKKLPGHSFDSWSFAKSTSALFHDTEGRAKLLARYDSEKEGPAKRMLEAMIAELGDPDALLAIVKAYASRGQAFDGTLRSAIEEVAVGQKPAKGWVNAYEQFGVNIAGLRKKLFEMLLNERERGIALACLVAIDKLRDWHGRPDTEPRHPDILSGYAWPLEAQ